MSGFPLNGFGVIGLKKKYSTVGVRIFLTETPTKHNIDQANQFLRSNNITAVFCFTKQRYDADDIQATVYRFEIKDGSSPNRANSTLLAEFTKTFNSLHESMETFEPKTVAGKTVAGKTVAGKRVAGKELQLNLLFHCDSGYGRAPTMLAYTMISYFHMNDLKAISQIRKVRKGAINAKQLEWLAFMSDSKHTTCSIL